MFSLTRTALEQFDNQHDFERMAADILNAIGYTEVVPIAPRGGSDGGKDITFTTESGEKGLACVTLRQDIDVKFRQDFSQRTAGEFEKYIFFCTASLTAKQKRDFIGFCLQNLQAELLPYDIETLRSLLDSSLRNIRDFYLNMDVAKNTEKQVAKNVVTFLEDRRVLYNSMSSEEEVYSTSSVVAIRQYLTEKINELDQNGELMENLRMMRSACRKFLDLDATQRLAHSSSRSFNYILFYDALGEMRGVFGVCLSRIVSLYKLNIEKDLARILPDSSDKE